MVPLLSVFSRICVQTDADRASLFGPLAFLPKDSWQRWGISSSTNHLASVSTADLKQLPEQFEPFDG
jgi:hypothetical protein